VVDNEQPRPQGPGNLPEVPETPPAGVDPETFRQFQEFQRFQQFQRFNQGEQPPPPAAPPWTAEGGNLEPFHGQQPPGPGHPAVHHQLAGVQQQLTQIQQSQAKIERATNPPLWRKILRSTPFRWAVGLLVIVLIAIWGVPALVQHYVGGDNDQHTNTAGKPTSIQQSGQLAGAPYDAVADIYLFPAEGMTPDKSCLTFSASAAKSFAQAFSTSSCPAAFTKIASMITDKDAYSDPDTSKLPTSPTGDTVTVDSCDLGVTGGPRLGTFTVTHVDKGWLITGYQAQQPCPAPAPPTPTS
jgi:hypothetical protein